MAAKDELGRRGERLAADYLCARGMRLVTSNWRCPLGEVDLVLADGRTMVFVEVKTRSSTRFGHPFEAISASKMARLRRLAVEWCRTEGFRGEIRVDAVGVIARAGSEPVIEHLRGVH